MGVGALPVSRVVMKPSSLKIPVSFEEVINFIPFVREDCLAPGAEGSIGCPVKAPVLCSHGILGSLNDPHEFTKDQSRV
jgi:hypothetical protein